MLRPEDVRRHAEMLGNRVKKNHRALAKKMAANGTGAFRLYDRDIPEVRAVVDWYEGELVVSEYAREQTAVVPGYVDALGDGVATAMGVDRAKVHCPDRHTRGTQRLEPMEVRENGMTFEVRLDDHPDTGLRTDLREVRRMVRAEAAGKRYLGLYVGTGTFTVAAAVGGAQNTDSVDPQGKNLTRVRKNLALNDRDRPEHWTTLAEVRDFLTEARAKRRSWDLAVVEVPPSGDVELEAAFAVMAPGSTMYVVATHPRMAPDVSLMRTKACEEITKETVPDDHRNKEIHRCWRVRF